jgi:hypothetical protein
MLPSFMHHSFTLNTFKKELYISVIMRKPVSNQTDYNRFYRTEDSQLLICKITRYRIKRVKFNRSASYTTSKNEGKHSVGIISLPELPVCDLKMKIPGRRTLLHACTACQRCRECERIALHERSWISEVAYFEQKMPALPLGLIARIHMITEEENVSSVLQHLFRFFWVFCRRPYELEDEFQV